MSSTPEVSCRPNEEGNREERVPRIEMVNDLDAVDEMLAYIGNQPVNLYFEVVEGDDEHEDEDIITGDGDNVQNRENAQGTRTQTQESGTVAGDGLDAHRKQKRKKKSAVWEHFEEVMIEVNGEKIRKVQCQYCTHSIPYYKGGCTTNMGRHVADCASLKREEAAKQVKQSKHNFPTGGTLAAPGHSYLYFGKFDMATMKESAAEWVCMHEHPFAIVEEEGFNIMQKRGMSEWTKITRVAVRKDCFAVYEREKEKLKLLLKKGHVIADEILKCLRGWGLENKVYTLSVDNASNNDTCIRSLKSTFSKNRCLLLGGKLFQVRCCAHILNLLVQDGLTMIPAIVEVIRKAVDYINRSDSRRLEFAKALEQASLPDRVLLYDCKTSQFLNHISSVESDQPQKNELDTYFEDGRLTKDNVAGVDLVSMDVLKWWKESSKYKILSRMAADILAIPISTVVSEATFSAGTRVIDSYRASLAPHTV
ncbi:hypothetical protein OROMI_025145 [Orobanche minor]